MERTLLVDLRLLLMLAVWRLPGAIGAVVGVVLMLVVSTPAQTGSRAEVLATAALAPILTPTATATPAGPTPLPTVAPPTPVPPTPTPAPVVERSGTMAFVGDILSHADVYRQAANYGDDVMPYDYQPMFDRVTPHLAGADLALCVLETPVSDGTTPLSGYPTFNAPRELPDALHAVGFDGCAVASNHAFDKGRDGVVATLEQLDRVGLGHTGTARSQVERDTTQLYDMNGILVAHLSFTYGLNGFVLPEDEPWLVNVTDPELVLSDAQRARDAGADLIVVSLQWGEEYRTEPTDAQVALAEQLTASPNVDLIVGNHAHVIQPIDIVNDTYVVYGLGNFLSNQSVQCCPARTQDGVIVQADVVGNDRDGYRIAGLSAVPTRVNRENYSIVPIVEALADPNRSAEAERIYSEVLERTRTTLEQRGVSVPLR